VIAGAKLIFVDQEWLSLSGEDRALAGVAAMLFHEGGAPHARVAVTEHEMLFDVRHLYHRPSGSKGPKLDNIMRRLFLLFPAKNGVDVFGFDAEGPHMTVKRNAVDWSRALEDWKICGAVGSDRTRAEVKR
jgi:hypothetical protein